jgi:hypothetical protein
LASDPAAKRFNRWFGNRAGPKDPGRLKALAFKAGGFKVIYNGLYFRKFGHFTLGSGFRVQGSGFQCCDHWLSA